jgi:alpha-beta hydrolase superfamily lysophospholipase
MSFGYNSRLFERKTMDHVQDWAEYLLSAVGNAREDPIASSRPIIFICHSMGGLVGRKAMERLFFYPSDYPGISLSNCGLLFLSTPHLGTIEADYGEFLTGVLSSLFGLRNEAILKELQSFNSSAVEATKAWGTMRKDKKMPPFECLCESRQTKLPIRGYREVRPFLVS